MCQFSLEAFKSRSAQQGEILTLQQFETGTMGFVSPNNSEVAVCLLPGTKAIIASLIKFPGEACLTPGTKVTFAEKIMPDAPAGERYHKDALQFGEGMDPILLQQLPEGLTIEVVEVATAKKHLADAPAPPVRERAPYYTFAD